MIELRPGTVVAGTYRVDARLGSGAFGAVYRANHRFLGRVALKLIAIEDARDLDRLGTEGSRHASLNHPNITRVFDVNTAEIGDLAALYISSEYMAIGDLDHYLQLRQRLPIAEVSVLADQLLSGLGYAHSRTPPVLHRDIKPSNILLDRQPTMTFKLADFGVSAEVIRMHGVAAAAGTVAFQPPECAFGPYLVQSDLYGAALVIFRALTGTYPFGGMLTSTASAPVDHRNPAKPSSFRFDCSSRLDEILLTALNADPFKRQRDVETLRQDLMRELS